MSGGVDRSLPLDRPAARLDGAAVVLAEGDLRKARARLFTARAEAFCRDTAGRDNNAFPTLPGW